MVLDDENRFSIQNLLHPGLSVGLCLCIKLTDKARWIARKLQASKKQIAKRPAIAQRSSLKRSCLVINRISGL
ncbi:hypothetical protein AYI78_02950 [Shewanella algae]|nr:hypothetical protein AYI97_20055 [Shewanella algae]TVO87275.1 hypothetical protein AYI76_04595 [Shewanella algae]TVO88808.1 hypothetical protein AYI78_02950 [Shewanella algae]TVO98618.1 hypothetical protein AYI79_02950 [Shewanella algae]